MKYTNFKYIYPPRPSNAIPQSDLKNWDNDTLVSQPKLNGSNCEIYTNGEDFIAMNRHGGRLTNFKMDINEIRNIYIGKGEWMVINGEYMNKSQKDENGVLFNNKFVIFDILVLNGDYLLGKTFQERISILDDVYGKEDSEKDYLYKITDNVYRVKSFYSNFDDVFENLTKIEMIEGLVMKRKNARLEIGATENNNVKSQLKCRKVTKNYKY